MCFIRKGVIKETMNMCYLLLQNAAFFSLSRHGFLKMFRAGLTLKIWRFWLCNSRGWKIAHPFCILLGAISMGVFSCWDDCKMMLNPLDSESWIGVSIKYYTIWFVLYMFLCVCTRKLWQMIQFDMFFFHMDPPPGFWWWAILKHYQQKQHLMPRIGFTLWWK